MISKIAGQLHPVAYDPDFFESAPYPIPYFNNKKLKIGFIEAKHQPYLAEADQVLQNFLDLTSDDRINNAPAVWQYYDKTLKHGYAKPLNIKAAEDIWQFIYPSEIIIHWNERGDFYLCVSCGCAWEEEHGLQLVFKNGQVLTRTNGHDGGLTD